MVRELARRSKGPRRRNDAEETHHLHDGQRAPRVQRRQDAAGQDELQAETRSEGVQCYQCMPLVARTLYHVRRGKILLVSFNSCNIIETFYFIVGYK